VHKGGIEISDRKSRFARDEGHAMGPHDDSQSICRAASTDLFKLAALRY